MELYSTATAEGARRSPASIIKHLANRLQELVEHSGAPQPVLPLIIPSFANCTLSENPLPNRNDESITSWLFDHIVPYLNGSSLSPNYYGFVTGGTTPAALAADVLVSYFDQNVAVHLPRETIATTIEVAALNMLIDLFQLPKDVWGIGASLPGSGTFTTGATASNVQGLALGREWVLSSAAKEATGMAMSVGANGLLEVSAAAGITRLQILSTMPHSSIAKSASIIGIGRANVISIAKSGEALEIDMAKLEREASKSGVASILALSAGEVNTGRFTTSSLSQLRQIRKICDRHNIWIHVDGAFGLFGGVLQGVEDASEYAAILDGIHGLELADSITGDGHKLLNVPYDCGFFFTKHGGLAEKVFGNGNAAYLTSGAGPGTGDGVSSPLNIGIENSRRFRALPVCTTLIAYGRKGYQDMLRHQIGLARRIAGWLFDHDQYDLLPEGERRETMIAKTFIVVLFRAKDPELNDSLVTKINSSRRIYVTGTKWNDISAARIAVSNWQADIESDGRLIEEVLAGALSH